MRLGKSGPDMTDNRDYNAPAADTVAALRREAERLEEDAIYSSKGHFNAEDTWVIHTIFRGHYLAQVKKALDAGTIAGPVEGDETFAKAFPQTYKFIVRLSGAYKQPGPRF